MAAPGKGADEPETGIDRREELLAGVELSSAVLCLELDCNMVFDRSARERCPRCGGAESYPLAAWLDREGAEFLRRYPTAA